MQSYLSYDDIDVKNAIHQKRTTADVDFQRRAIVNDSNDFIWGVGYRYSVDHIDS